MDHVIQVQYLVQADDDAASAVRAIFRQRELILDLERDGLEAAEARRLLASFEEVLNAMWRNGTLTKSYLQGR
jgi:hypothetical protein